MSDTSPPPEKAGAAATRQRRSRTKWILLGLIAFLVVAIGVGVGVGVGVGTKKHKSKSTAASASGSSSSDATASGSLISQASLYGDQNRWIGSKRNFDIGALPTTREFDWTISSVLAAPGGYAKDMIVVNGMSPGPVLEANAGDLLRIHVHNQLPNSTSLHWHGMHLPHRGYMDGTHGITQCGIPANSTFTYEWVAEQGTSWWHAHSGGQYTDGLYGAIVFHPGSNSSSSSSTSSSGNGTAAGELWESGVEAKYDDEVTLLLSDLYNTPAPALQWRFTALGTGIDGQPGDEPTPDGGAINGVSQAKCAYIPQSDLVIAERRRRTLSPTQAKLEGRSYTHGEHFDATNYCGTGPTTYYNLTLDAGGTYRLRIVNAGSFVNSIFSVDGHVLTIVEADGVAVVPFNVSSIELAVGQRYSALVTLDQSPGAYWIRNELSKDAIRYTSPNFSDTTLAVLRYSGVASDLMPSNNVTNEALRSLSGLDAEKADMDLLKPVSGADAPKARREQYTVQFNMQYIADNRRFMFFNDSAWEPVAGQADLLRIRPDASFASAPGAGSGVGDQINVVTPSSNSTTPSSANDTATDSAEDVVDLIVNSLDDGAHPFHLHGHRFWVLSSGGGHFTGDSSTLNTTNVMRRDTLQIPSYGHAVLRFTTTNAGVWAFHCHISWHMELGLLMTFTHRPDEIRGWTLPEGFEGMCNGETTAAADDGNNATKAG